MVGISDFITSFSFLKCIHLWLGTLRTCIVNGGYIPSVCVGVASPCHKWVLACVYVSCQSLPQASPSVKSCQSMPRTSVRFPWKLSVHATNKHLNSLWNWEYVKTIGKTKLLPFYFVDVIKTTVQHSLIAIYYCAKCCMNAFFLSYALLLTNVYFYIRGEAVMLCYSAGFVVSICYKQTSVIVISADTSMEIQEYGVITSVRESQRIANVIWFDSRNS